jgi:Holliday junction resolvasome RuvABC endonuclease subunit
VTRLGTRQTAKIWSLENFLNAIPEGVVKTFRANVIGFHDPILPQGGIGVDPGLRLGLSYIEAEDVAFTLSLYINRQGLTATQLLSVCQKVPMLFPRRIQRKVPVCVEGAAYNARYGQADLGEVRAALILGFHNEGYELVAKLQPKHIRKVVFGDGNTQPKDFWPMLYNHGGKDSVDALSMAICAGL